MKHAITFRRLKKGQECTTYGVDPLPADFGLTLTTNKPQQKLEFNAAVNY